MVRVGIVGAGRMGRVHARYGRQVPGVEVAAVADLVVEKAQALAAVAGVPAAPVFGDHGAMLDTVELALAY